MSLHRAVRTSLCLLAGIFWLQAAVILGQVPHDRAASGIAGTPPQIPTHVEQPYFDLDAYLESGTHPVTAAGDWHWQLLPTDLIYKSYLAGVKEPRIGTDLSYIQKDGWVWQGVLGARVGLLRYGDEDPLFPQGFQLDAEGAANVRLDIEQDVDVRSTDYRVGVPMTYGFGCQQLKLAYYHMSSHLGDEFVLRNPGYPRLNWSRDAMVLGYSVFMTETLRLYAEAGFGFHTDQGEPWEFQLGADWAPITPTGFGGAPFLAVNGHLRQDVDYGGNVNLMAGWSWLTERDRHLLRMGVQYYNGQSSQYSFYHQFEEQIGFGIWYDF